MGVGNVREQQPRADKLPPTGLDNQPRVDSNFQMARRTFPILPERRHSLHLEPGRAGLPSSGSEAKLRDQGGEGSERCVRDALKRQSFPILDYYGRQKLRLAESNTGPRGTNRTRRINGRRFGVYWPKPGGKLEILDCKLEILD
jgi:hypothetical protein